MQTYDCIVVGAGISGLSAAYTLYKRGASVLVVEKLPRIGGAIWSEQTDDGFVLEHGTQTISSEDPALWQHFADLGIAAKRIVSDTQRMYLPYNGALHRLSLSPPALMRSPILSLPGKLRVLAEPFLPRAVTPDESIAQFFTRRLGSEFTHTLVEPFVSGVYGGDLNELSMRALFPNLWTMEQRYGNLVRGAMATMWGHDTNRRETFGFQGGLATWPHALADALPPENIWLQASAVALKPDEQCWELTVERGGQHDVIHASRVILAVPAYAAAHLVADLEPVADHSLQTLHYPPLAVVHLAYRRDAIPHPLDGFGVLYASHTRSSALGMLWMSTIFPGCAPEGMVLITTFVGGSRAPEIAHKTSDELVAIIHREQHQQLGIRDEPSLAHVRSWAHAIPQYDAAHERRVATFNRLEARWPGLHLISSYRQGFSVESCWEQARDVAENMVLVREGESVIPN